MHYFNYGGIALKEGEYTAGSPTLASSEVSTHGIDVGQAGHENRMESYPSVVNAPGAVKM